MKKRTKLLGSAIAVMLMGTMMVGCSDDSGKVKDNTKEVSEETVEKKVSDADLAKELGKVESPVFKKITDKDLTGEEKEIVNILKNAVGVNLHGEDLFIIVPKQGESKVRFITEVHEDEKIVKVYLKKVGTDEEGEDYMLGRIKDLAKENYEVWFMDAETKEPIQLEDLEKEVSKESGEKSEATTVETDDKDAKGKVEPKEEKKESSEKKDKE